MLTLPEARFAEPPVPVVIFGHPIVTDRRFGLAVAGALAQRGFALFAIDLPFHGERTACVDDSLIALPNFLPPELQELTGLTDALLSLPPCRSGEGATCGPEGRCLDRDGQPEPFSTLVSVRDRTVLIDMRPASGAAFLDTHDVPHIPDHFVQALVDLGAAKHSLRHGNWEEVTGVPLATDRFHYVGVSLGSILGVVFTAVSPDVEQAVFNVPGADLVDLFMDSVYFGPQFDELFVREGATEGSLKQERLLNVARWLIDTVDPQSVAHVFRDDGRRALLQIDTGEPAGDIVIPNRTSRALQRVSGLPMLEYPSTLHGDMVIPLVGDRILDDAARFLAGSMPR